MLKRFFNKRTPTKRILCPMSNTLSEQAISDGLYWVRNVLTPDAEPRQIQVKDGRVIAGLCKFTIPEFFSVNEVVENEPSN